MRFSDKREIVKFIRYFAGAAAGLACDWTVTLIVLNLFGNPVAAQAAGKAAGAVLAFFLYRHAVFTEGSTAGIGQQGLRFILASSAGWLVSVVIFGGFLGIMKWLPAKIVSDGVTFIVNWFVMKLWVFRSRV